jgi:ethanolamine utilization protein EutN
MQIALVVGTVVATRKHGDLTGAKLLLVQPETPEGEPRGPVLLSIDSVGAGVGERVLVVIEGKAAGDALGKRGAPVDAAIVGIIDQVDDVGLGDPTATPIGKGSEA